MKILTAKQVREADQFTIKNEPIDSIQLMERASKSCFEFIHRNFQNQLVNVICGKGNNGGDGLVIARMLSAAGWKVRVIIIEMSPDASEDFTVNWRRLEECSVDVCLLDKGSDLILENGLLIDAIFGSGLSRSISGWLGEVIEKLNQFKGKRIAIDFPSGLFADKPSNGVVFKADYTLTFQVPKLALLMAENEKYLGEVHILNIGLSEDFIQRQNTPYAMITSSMIRSISKGRPKFAHKGTFGHARIIAGSVGKIGAAILSSHAALKSGAGLVSLFCPKVGLNPVQSKIPEVMVETDETLNEISTMDYQSEYTYGIGPGLGVSETTMKAFNLFLNQAKNPMVVDADGINLLAKIKIWDLPRHSIITPHPKEFARLTNCGMNSFEQLDQAKELSRLKDIIVVLKGAHTRVVLPSGKVFFNSTGNPGMSTGGSGDVLTGIITGLLSQGYSPENAAIVGVYEHGRAGDKAKVQGGENGVVANDLIEFLTTNVFLN